MRNENYMAIAEGIQTFLADLGLVQYFDLFVMKGYDSEEDLYDLNEADLDNMMITDPDHRQLIIKAACQHRPSEQYRVLEWLRKHGLEYYYVNFLRSERTSIHDIVRTEIDEALFEDLEITLPGHKRRLERAVSELRKRQRTDGPTEQPLALGRWTKPQCLQDGKFDFLCVDATIYSTKDKSASNAHTLEFMVDTGSDVVTIRQEILDQLDLEVLGKIHSKGVHGSKTTNLYKAKLLIGNQELEIEVMGESYDSIGSRVVRHFRHYVDGRCHVWLRGNYSDKDTYLTQKSSIPALCDTETPPTKCSTKGAITCKPAQTIPQGIIPTAAETFTLANTKIPPSFNFSSSSSSTNPGTAKSSTSIEVTVVQGTNQVSDLDDRKEDVQDKYLKDTSPDELDI